MTIFSTDEISSAPYKSVLKPMNLSKITIPNRIVFPAFHTNYAEKDGKVRHVLTR